MTLPFHVMLANSLEFADHFSAPCNQLNSYGYRSCNWVCVFAHLRRWNAGDAGSESTHQGLALIRLRNSHTGNAVRPPTTPAA